VRIRIARGYFKDVSNIIKNIKTS